MASRLMLAEGRVQKSREGVVHLMASRIIDRTDLLDHLSHTDCAPVGPNALSRHPRNVRTVPRSRDDRKTLVSGKSVSARLHHVGRRISKKKTQQQKNTTK